jgi:hypothetical protein
MIYPAPPLSPVSDVSDSSPRPSPSKPTLSHALRGKLATGKLPKNVIAINNDLIQQLIRAPSELTQVYARDGYAGVMRWTERFHALSDAVVSPFSAPTFSSSTLTSLV